MTDLRVLENELSASTGIPDEKVRTFVSTRVTKILLLLGRLQPGYNPRLLPVTVNSALFLIGELDQLEKKSGSFCEILRENIELRQQSGVFLISDSLLMDPNCRGLRAMLFGLTNALVRSFCEEEKKFLSGMNVQVSPMVRFSLLARAEKNCKLLATICGAENCLVLNNLKEWCESAMLRYQ